MSNEMKSRELNAKMAELMGWVRGDSILGEYWVDNSEQIIERIDDWQPITDIAAAWQVEERIKELRLIDKYCMHLNANASARWRGDVHLSQLWQLIHASPEDRCLAAIRTMEAMEKRK